MTRRARITLVCAIVIAFTIAGFYERQRLLNYAAAKGSLPLVKLLLALGAVDTWLDPSHADEPSAMSEAADHGHEDVQHFLGNHHYSEKEKSRRATLATQLRELGPDNPSTLGTMTELFDVLSAEGKLAEAEKEFRAVIASMERKLGPENPKVLRERNDMALNLLSDGKVPWAATAEKEHRGVLSIQERTLGPEHPDTLVTRTWMAHALHAQGK
jgi:hypothetical protein